jgi:general secretion pathway protein N
MRSSVVLVIVFFVIGLFVIGDAKAQVLTAPLVVDHLQDAPAPRPKGVAPGLAAPSAISAAERAPSANPLWTIPLTSLTATGERPVFSPSRRPPVVVVAKASPPPPPPSKPPEPEKLLLSLVGTILGENGERIGLFVNPVERVDRNALRLKVGEDIKGWVLREVLPRQVVLEKGQQSAVLELPRRDVSKGGSGLAQMSGPSPPGVGQPPDSTPEDMRRE